MIRFYSLHEMYWPEISQACKIPPMVDTRGVMAVDDNKELWGAAVFDTFSYNMCHGHIYIKKPMVLRHGLLEEAFNFVYNTCDLDVMLATVLGDNYKALRFNENLGFKEVYRVRDGYNVGVDYVIMELRKRDCRFLPKIEEAA